MISEMIDTKDTFLSQNQNIVHSSKAFGRSIICAEDIFSVRLAKKANAEIDALPIVDNTISGNNIKRVVIDPTNTSAQNCFTLHFNDNNETEDWDYLVEKCTQSEETATYNLAKESINYMAKTIGWENQDVKMSTFILRYGLDSNNPIIHNLPWHQDFGMLSLTALITPYRVAEGKQQSGFNGGELSFCSLSKAGKEKYFSFERNPEKEYDLNTVQTFKYPENGGFIFDSLTSFHKVNDVTLYSQAKEHVSKVERRLLSVFVYSDTCDDVIKLANNKECKNAVNIVNN